MEVKSVTVQVKLGFPGSDAVSYQGALVIKNKHVVDKARVECKIHPTHKS